MDKTKKQKKQKFLSQCSKAKTEDELNELLEGFASSNGVTASCMKKFWSRVEKPIGFICLKEEDLALDFILPFDPNDDSGFRWNQDVLLPLMYSWSRAVEAKVIVEVGCWLGKSTLMFQKAAALNEGHLFTAEIIPDQNGLALAKEGKYASVWTPMIGDSYEIGKKWDKGPIDVLYIDGYHDIVITLRDWVAWEPHVRKGGVIFVHDTQHGVDPKAREHSGPPCLLSLVKQEYPNDYDVVNVDAEAGLGIIVKRK